MDRLCMRLVTLVIRVLRLCTGCARPLSTGQHAPWCRELSPSWAAGTRNAPAPQCPTPMPQED